MLVDVACGAGDPGLWAAQQTGATLIGVDPSAAGLAAARRRAGACRARVASDVPAGDLRADRPSRRLRGWRRQHRGVPVRARQAGRPRRASPHPPARSTDRDRLLRGGSAQSRRTPCAWASIPTPTTRPSSRQPASRSTRTRRPLGGHHGCTAPSRHSSTPQTLSWPTSVSVPPPVCSPKRCSPSKRVRTPGASCLLPNASTKRPPRRAHPVCGGADADPGLGTRRG